jgi:Tol biopolymer transport system component
MDGSGPIERLSKSATPNYVTDWSREGSMLAYTDLAIATKSDLWVLPLSGDRTPELFLGTPFNEDNAVFSLNGRWIAYDSDQSGRPEVYIRPFHAAGGLYKVSRSGGMRRSYAVTKDGKPFLAIIPEQRVNSALITVFVNWLAAGGK